MEAVRSRLNRQRIAVFLIGAFLSVAVLELRGVAMVSYGAITLRPVAAPTVVAGFLFGAVAVTGVATGYLAYVVASGQFGPVPILEWAGAVLLGFGTAVLVAGWSLGASGVVRRRPRVPFRHLFVAGGGVVLTVSAVLALGYEILGVASFFPFSVTTAADIVASVLVLAGPVVALSLWLPDRQFTDRTHPSRPERRTSDGGEGGEMTDYLGVSALWFVLGNLLSAGFHALELVPPAELSRREVGFLRPLAASHVFGHGGQHLQVALGAFCLVLLLGILYRS